MLIINALFLFRLHFVFIRYSSIFYPYKVINETISKDLTEATNAVNAQERELQTERVRLIKIKIKTEIGEDVEFDIDAGKYVKDAASK